MNKALDQPSKVARTSSRCAALLGSSAVARRARQAARVAARSSTCVLVSREAGCLGGQVARSIHEASARAEFPFVSIECDDDSSVLVARLSAGPGESIAAVCGRDAPQATVFLDPLEDLSPAAQTDLARSFATGRLGTDASNVRILAGTRVDLKARAAAGAFRQDLYYHVAVVVVEVPPLRDRPEDIPELLSNVLSDLCASSKRQVPRIPRRVVELCQRYSWPGNARELRCIAKRLLASSESARLKVAALPDEIRHPTLPRRGDDLFRLPPDGLNLGELERHLIQQALERQGGNRTQAARMLGLSRQTLLYRMQKHGLR
ncbi:MAG: AAA family ATPase [Gammaproteobacteria bacterium]|nr:AAA family ATPase [Gammaproteobacteria bacterium]